MPNLGDYLGHLVAEITMARMHADLESVRVAELYASHPLLKHMSVPRFTLPEVELEVPVLISGMEEAAPGTPPRGGVDVKELRKVFDKVLESTLASEQVPMPGGEKVKLLGRELDRVLERHVGPAETSADIGRLASDFVKPTLEALGGEKGPGASKLEKLRAELTQRTQVEFLKRRSAPPRLGVDVLTAHVRDSGAAQHVTRIKLKITEHAAEWATMEVDGNTESRLVPE